MNTNYSGTAYLILGSNLGDKATFLKESRERLSKIAISPISVSHIYESEPWGFETNLRFYNQVVKMETRLTPHELLGKVLEIEDLLGRDRNQEGDNKALVRKYSSRVIDIDILFYNNLIITSEDLVLPHPRIHLRKFTLAPLNEIAPDLVHPVLKKTISCLLEETSDTSEVIRVPE